MFFFQGFFGSHLLDPKTFHDFKKKSWIPILASRIFWKCHFFPGPIDLRQKKMEIPGVVKPQNIAEQRGHIPPAFQLFPLIFSAIPLNQGIFWVCFQLKKIQMHTPKKKTK